MIRALLVTAAAGAIAAGIGMTPTASADATQPIHPTGRVVIAQGCPVGDYENVDGSCVPRPTQAPSAPPSATAQCGDGSYSSSQHRSGTCSGHGGVAQWL
jgi:hypothetical protein